MTVPASSIKLRDVRNEFGQTSGQYSLRDAAEASINDCSAGGDQIAPYVLGGWANYNHAALPAAASGFSGNPGDDSSPNSDPQQDSHVYMSWNPITCAGAYDVLRSTTSGGSFSVIANDISNEFYVDNITSPQVSRYYKVRGISQADGTLTSELHLRTTPQAPINVVTSVNENCSNYVITVQWSNGSSPGIRSSITNWRQRKNGGSWSSYTSTALGATSFIYPAAGAGSISVEDFDEHDFELYYADRSGTAKATVDDTASCFQ